MFDNIEIYETVLDNETYQETVTNGNLIVGNGVCYVWKFSSSGIYSKVVYFGKEKWVNRQFVTW